MEVELTDWKGKAPAGDPSLDDQEVRRVYLKPAELVVCRKPHFVTTLLGSCVAVVFWLPVSRAGAVCHAMLPHREDSDDNPFRYVDTSIHHIVKSLRIGSLRKGDVVTKLFGGAELIGVGLAQVGPMAQAIGQNNVRAAQRILGELGIPPVVAEVGGTEGYKLHVRTDTGEVYLKRLSTALLTMATENRKRANGPTRRTERRR